MICSRCTQDKPPHKHRPNMCDDCAKADGSRVAHQRNNHDWMELAKIAEVDLWERQPQETDHEYHVWLRYRDAYPGKRPTYKDVAEEVGISVDAVRHVAKRWSFMARMQAWVQHVDSITMHQREQEILEMNKQHVDMAQVLNAKIATAINQINPHELTPREINALMKTATELEKKARLDQMKPTTQLFVEENPELHKNEVKTSDIEEIVKILGSAGILENFGVKQTVTTEVVVKDND